MTLIESRLRVMTWNLWWRFGPWEDRLPAIAATLASVDADVFALQEVWHDGERSEAAELADRLGFHHVYAARLELDEVQMGNAVLSRWPITGHDSRPLPAPSDADELRTVVRADIDGPRGPLQVFSTHLNWRFDQSHVRQDQIRTITDFVHDSPLTHLPAGVVRRFQRGSRLGRDPHAHGPHGHAGEQAGLPRLVGGGDRARGRPGVHVVERQRVREGGPRAESADRLRVRGLAQAGRCRPRRELESRCGRCRWTGSSRATTTP